jgi:hypothetical protein
MGAVSFILPEDMPTAARAALSSACFAAAMGGSGSGDLAPIPSQMVLADGRLTVTRNLSESGFLLVPWPVGPAGCRIAATATLREAAEPYRLLIELARGKLNQVRTQASDWVGIGLRLTQGFEDNLADTTRLFAKALLAPPSAEADHLAAQVLEQAFRLADELTRRYTDQLFDTRHHEEGLLDTRLAARMIRPGEAGGEYGRTFNAAQVGLTWRDIEPEEAKYDWSAADAAVRMAKAAELPLTIGPVIDLAPGMLPGWMTAWAGDLPTLAAFMCDFLETAVARYKEDVRRWVICAGFNQADALGLGDDERMRLAFRLFESAASVDPNLELVISVAQPWGDYLVNEAQTISPLTFPDDLMRAGVKLSGLEVELRQGVVPRGSLPRDLLEVARVINLFGVLQLPLEVLLSMPGTACADPMAKTLGQDIWLPETWDLTPGAQAEWGSAAAALALAIPHVRAVTWDHWSDADSHLTPHGGLVDGQGVPKPLLARLRTLRSAHLR